MPDVPIGGLASAISANPAGSTLELLDGTHSTGGGRQTISKQLTIKAKSFDPGTMAGKYVTDAVGHNASDFAVTIDGGVSCQASSIVFQGINFRGRLSGGAGSVDIDANSIIFEDCRFHDEYNYIMIIIGSNDARSDVTFRRCRFTRIGSRAAHDHPIYAKTARNMIVEDCIFYKNAGWAFHMYTDCDNAIIRRCVVDDSNGGVTFSGDTANTVLGGYQYSTGNVIEDCIFSRNRGSSPSAYGSEDYVQSLWLANFWYGGSPSGVNYIRRSDFWVGNSTPPQGGRIQSGSPIVVEGTVINADPLFTDPDNGNFRLQAGSPAIGMGPTYIQPGGSPPPDPPNPVSGVSASTSPNTVSLSWTNPSTGPSIDQVIVRRSTTAFPALPTDGTSVVTDSVAPYINSHTDTGLTNGVTYYYSIFTRATQSSTVLYSTAAQITGTPTAAPPPPPTTETRSSGIIRTGPVRTGSVRTGAIRGNE